MAEKRGIKELKEVVEGVGAVLRIVEISKDGFQIQDTVEFAKAVPTITKAILGIGDIDDELRDLSREEYDELCQLAIDKWGITDEEADIDEIIVNVLRAIGDLLEALYIIKIHQN